MSKYAGIDYGLGKANLDPNTGIRYGVIKISSLHEFIYDELELDYGNPTCPECGNEVIDSPHGKDYFCEHCADQKNIIDADGEVNEDLYKDALKDVTFWSDQVSPDEPLGQYIDDDTYSAHDAFDNSCLFVTRSPYYTLAEFCSPCAPGAGDLDSPNEDGIKTLCFGHEMFEDGKAPYPVYRVSDNSLVNPE